MRWRPQGSPQHITWAHAAVPCTGIVGGSRCVSGLTPTHICARTGARRCHICAGTGLGSTAANGRGFRQDFGCAAQHQGPRGLCRPSGYSRMLPLCPRALQSTVARSCDASHVAAPVLSQVCRRGAHPMRRIHSACRIPRCIAHSLAAQKAPRSIHSVSHATRTHALPLCCALLRWAVM